jgi:small subunit ribosomal protein S9
MAEASVSPSEYVATGRRKTAVVRVRIRPGQGQILINGKPYQEYFPGDHQCKAIVMPFEVTGTLGQFEVHARAAGGGMTGQADALKLGIARALKLYNPEFYPILREAGLLTRDPRKKERKKYGLHAARRGTQFSKR